MLIRTAEYSDVEPLLAYAQVLFAEGLPGIFHRPAPTVEGEFEFVRSHLEPDNSTLLLAEEDGCIVGLIAILGGQLPEERHVGEFGISVANGFRGRGIGTALMQTMLAWAPEHGISRIQCHAWASNPGSIRLYERMGFVREGCMRGAIIRGGESIDVYLMARLLP